MKCHAAMLCAWTMTACAGDTSTTDDLAPARAFEREVAGLCGLTLTGDPMSGALGTALAEGQARFEAAEATQCLAWLRANGCSHAHAEAQNSLALLLIKLPGLCRSAYSGSVAIGEACSHSVACAGDSYCKAISETLAQCAPRSLVGEPCFSLEECSVTDEQVPDCLPDSAGTKRCAAEPLP